MGRAYVIKHYKAIFHAKCRFNLMKHSYSLQQIHIAEVYMPFFNAIYVII